MTETVKIGISRIVSAIDVKHGYHENTFDRMMDSFMENDLYNEEKPIKITISQDTGYDK